MDEDVASDALDSVLEGFYEVSLKLGLGAGICRRFKGGLSCI